MADSGNPFLSGIFSTFASLIGRSADSKDAWNTNQYNKQFARDEAEKNRQFQRDERLASQEFNLDMWHRNNEYNSPANQLKLMKEAGINPNSLKGNSFVSSSPVETSPMSGTPTAMPSDASGAFLGRSPAMLGSIGNIINSVSTARKAETESALNQYSLDWNRLSESDRLKELKTNIKYQESHINGILKKAHLDEMSAKEIEERTKWISRLNDAELKLKMQSLTNLYNQNIEFIKNSEQQRKESESNIALNEQRISESEANVELSKRQGTYVESQTHKHESENLMLKLETQFADELGMPIGTSDEQFYFKLWKQGLLPKFIDEVRVPLERSAWKPRDYKVDRGNYGVGFNYKTGYFNPTWRSTFNAEFDASNPLRIFKR